MDDDGRKMGRCHMSLCLSESLLVFGMDQRLGLAADPSTSLPEQSCDGQHSWEAWCGLVVSAQCWHCRWWRWPLLFVFAFISVQTKKGSNDAIAKKQRRRRRKTISLSLHQNKEPMFWKQELYSDLHHPLVHHRHLHHRQHKNRPLLSNLPSFHHCGAWPQIIFLFY